MPYGRMIALITQTDYKYRAGLILFLSLIIE